MIKPQTLCDNCTALLSSTTLNGINYITLTPCVTPGIQAQPNEPHPITDTHHFCSPTCLRIWLLNHYPPLPPHLTYSKPPDTRGWKKAISDAPVIPKYQGPTLVGPRCTHGTPTHLPCEHCLKAAYPNPPTTGCPL